MKLLLVRLWNEPAFFISVASAAGVTVLQCVSLPDQIEIPLSALFVLVGGALTRQLVTPTRR